MTTTLQEQHDQLSVLLEETARELYGLMGEDYLRGDYEDALYEVLLSHDVAARVGAWIPERVASHPLSCGYRIDLLLGEDMAVGIASNSDEFSERLRAYSHLISQRKIGSAMVIGFYADPAGRGPVIWRSQHD
jgi:hypothetical protein